MFIILELNGVYTTPPYTYHVIPSYWWAKALLVLTLLEKDLLITFCVIMCVNVSAWHPNGEAVIGNWGSNNVL